MSGVYLLKKRYIKRIRSLYLKIDLNDSDSISLNEFFDLIDTMEKNPKYHVPLIPDSEYWHKIRLFINKYLKFKYIGKNIYFEIFMFVVLTLNCSVIIAATIVSE